MASDDVAIFGDATLCEEGITHQGMCFPKLGNYPYMDILWYNTHTLVECQFYFKKSLK